MTFSRSNNAGIIRSARDFLFVACLCLPSWASAQTAIHQCTDADGGIVFSQLPCPPQKPVEPEKAAPEEQVETAEPEPDSEYDDVELFVAGPAEETAGPAEDRAACQKPIRDAIDAIDAEIAREYTPEKAEQYKQRLLELTGKLRQC